MGYEIKLMIGKAYESQRGPARDYRVDPPRDLGFEETYFRSYAEIDLCKLDYSGEFHARMREWKNNDKTHLWFFLAGNNKVREDCYSDRYVPQRVSVVLKALKADRERGEYRRLDWAIALLESMVDDREELKVLVFGH